MTGAVDWDTEREHIEETRARLAAIVESSQDAIIGKTLDGIITSWNSAAEQLYGYTSQEAVGQHISIIVPPERLYELNDIFERIRRGERIGHRDTVRVCKDGSRVDVSISISPVRGVADEIVGAATIARDITERRRAEEERAVLLARERAARARAEETQRRLEFLSVASAVLTASLNYETTLANLAQIAVREIADWCVVDVVDDDGSTHRLATAHADPAKEAFVREYQKRRPPSADPDRGVSVALKTGTSQLVPEISEEQLVAGARDDEELQILHQLGLRSAMVVPLLARGRIVGAITFIAAESGRRYDESDLALAEDLARRAAVAVDNARLYDQAQEALRLRDEFLSIASHELKTPLTSLQLQTQLLQRFIRSGSAVGGWPERTTATLETVERQIKRLTRLINDLLDVSRIAAGRLEFERHEMDLVSLVREVTSRLDEEATLAGSTVDIRAEGEVIGCWDRLRLDQVVMNLLSNAIKYGRGQPIVIAVTGDDSKACLTVQDNGIGIPSDQLPKVFQRFERLGSSRNYGGLGLGLYIAHQIVEGHGGAIRIRSEPDRGSTFEVTLPRSPGEGSEASE